MRMLFFHAETVGAVPRAVEEEGRCAALLD